MGAEVWFADIDPETYLIDINKVKKLIESKPKGFFKGIIPVDFAGLPVDTEKLRNLAKTHNLWIIEDACHAPGGYYRDSNGNKQMCGNGHFIDIGVFSFHPVKHIACGEGGMITTNSKSIYQKVSLLRSHGISKLNMSQNHGNWYYEMRELGFNYRLTDIQASLGISQLSKNYESLHKRNQIAKEYKKKFNDIINYQHLPSGSYNAHHLFVIQVNEREKLYNYLHSKGIYVQIHYIPIHLLPYYKKIGYEDANLKFAENYYSKCLSLPMYPTLKTNEQNYIIENVINFIKS